MVIRITVEEYRWLKEDIERLEKKYLALLEENETLHKEVLSEMALGEYWKRAYLSTWDYQVSNKIINLRIRLSRLRVKVLEMFQVR
jgi:hypothetical protein